jgi:2-amino-4-hydroxy-6-hydroxymethyldihydropteridine diphosphokinase
MKVVIALGSNIGDSEAILNGALKELSEFCKIDKVSKFYETEPVGGPEQSNFLNAVLVGDSNLDPHELLIRCLEIENKFGRSREVRWGPRTLDIDLISVGTLQIKSDNLTLPHPLAHERAFVLEPWYEIDPAGELIGKGPISEFLAALK